VATASENGKTANPDQESHEPRECMPCRGTGKLISNLGGSPNEVTCPWCEGGGMRLAGIDAQARWPGAEGAAAGQAADSAAAGQAADSEAAGESAASESASGPS
jgi:hypothetical protein